MEEDFNWENFAPLYAEIFSQLVANPQFNTFFATHYNLNIDVNDEDKCISVSVMPISQEETAQRMRILREAEADEGPKIITPELYKG